MPEIKEEVVIVNPLGMHARPAARLVETVLAYDSDVHVSHGGSKVNAKSIMGLLTLAAAQGSELTFTCKGPDAEDAMSAIRELVESGFGEM
jgi:phosphocarrier protein